MKTERILILETEFDEETNLVLWTIRRESNKIHKMCWDKKDLGTALGINQEIPNDLFIDFNNKMSGKEINMEIHADNMVENMSFYPFDKITKHLSNKGETISKKDLFNKYGQYKNNEK